VKSKEELSGTLCHEVSHTIHHDTVKLMEEQEKIVERTIGIAILLGPTRAQMLAILLVGKLHSLSYSRDAESQADLTGSDICDAAGYNPWGLDRALGHLIGGLELDSARLLRKTGRC
jgi:beta-barrel assembly-enhancing protease